MGSRQGGLSLWGHTSLDNHAVALIRMNTTANITYVHEPITGIKAGDVGEAAEEEYNADTGLRPYCFKLKDPHCAGAHVALAKYLPWWKDMKVPWGSGRPDVIARNLKNYQAAFNSWTIERTAKEKKVPTHVAMNSGTLYIPLGPEEDTFLEYYANCLAAGRKMYFVEQLVYPEKEGPPVFRLFMDLDFKQAGTKSATEKGPDGELVRYGITGQGIEAASLVCARVVAGFFPGRPSCTIVACTTYKNADSKDATGAKVELVKTGVHLYWPRHYVTPLQCLHIRESIVAALQETFGMRTPPLQNTWEDVVDKSVYGDAHGGRGSGLRMIGSCKTDKCPMCNGRGASKEGVDCGKCGKSRRVDDMDNQGRPGRPYMMFCVLGPPTWIGDEPGATNKPPAGRWALSARAAAAAGNGGPAGAGKTVGVMQPIAIERSLDLEAYYLGSMHKLICDTKLRTPLEAPKDEDLINGFDIPTGAPVYLAPAPGKKVAVGLGPKRGEKHLENTSPEYQAAQSVIREAFGDLYAHVVVRSIGITAKHYTVNVTGTNCRYCQNIGREHSSNNIYFTIDLVTGKKAIAAKAVVAQRCYDNGDITPEMRYGRCKEYTSQPFDVPPAYIKVLWPDADEGLSAFGPRQAPSAVAGTYLDGANCKRFMAAIEELSKKIYKVSWTATQGLQSHRRTKDDIATLVPLEKKDLGSRGVQAFSDLGFEWADKYIAAKLGHGGEDGDSQAAKPLQKTSDGAQKILLKAMRTICMITTTVTNVEIYAKAHYMDDFLRPTDGHDLDGADAENHGDLQMPDEADFAAGERGDDGSLLDLLMGGLDDGIGVGGRSAGGKSAGRKRGRNEPLTDGLCFVDEADV